MGCAGEATPPSSVPEWMIARREVTASDDPGVRLRRGFGVKVVERRGDRLLTSSGRWFSVDELEPATPFTGTARTDPGNPVARPLEAGARERWIDVDLTAQR